MKLDGIRVIDHSSFLPGPSLTLAMADHGAEVIKVEAPGVGDAARHIGLSDGAETVMFRNLNRGKQSVALDLKDAADRQALLRLVADADVFVESYRPGVAKRLGVDYETLSALNPRLVYCSISAFGQDGPYRARPAHDLAVLAMSGMLSQNVGSDGRPAHPAIPISDVLAGLYGLAGVLMALLRREKTGRGDHVDVSMFESAVGSMRNIFGPSMAEGRQPNPRHERSSGGAAFHDIYDTADGRQIVLSGQESKFVRALLGALDRLDLAPLAERGPGPHQEPLRAVLADFFRAKTVPEARAFLGSLDVCWGEMMTLPEVLNDPHLAERRMVVRDADGRPHLMSPIRFHDEPAIVSLDAPALGQHTERFREH